MKKTFVRCHKCEIFYNELKHPECPLCRLYSMLYNDHLKKSDILYAIESGSSWEGENENKK